MTAGSGIIHQEMPKGNPKGRMGGFQLWANLPKSHKMMDPRYREVKKKEIPEVTLDGGTRVRVICGTDGQGERPGPGHRHRARVPRRVHAGKDRLHPPRPGRPHGLCLRDRGAGLLRRGARRLWPRGSRRQLFRSRKTVPDGTGKPRSLRAKSGMPSSSRPKTIPSGSCWCPAGPSESPWPGTDPSS